MKTFHWFQPTSRRVLVGAMLALFLFGPATIASASGATGATGDTGSTGASGGTGPSGSSGASGPSGVGGPRIDANAFLAVQGTSATSAQAQFSFSVSYPSVTVTASPGGQQCSAQLKKGSIFGACVIHGLHLGHEYSFVASETKAGQVTYVTNQTFYWAMHVVTAHPVRHLGSSTVVTISAAPPRTRLTVIAFFRPATCTTSARGSCTVTASLKPPAGSWGCGRSTCTSAIIVAFRDPSHRTLREKTDASQSVILAASAG